MVRLSYMCPALHPIAKPLNGKDDRTTSALLGKKKERWAKLQMPYLENKKVLLVFIRNMVLTKICENY
jgi:hypothetical protein